MQKVFATVLSLAGLTNAWSINGHMIVANIGFNELEKLHPESLEAAQKLLTYLPKWNATYTVHEGDHAFVESATFADDMKYHGEMWQSDFHFKTLPNIEEGEESDYVIKSSTRNISVGLDDIVSWISGKGGDAYKDGYMYTFLMKKFENDENVAQSYALRLLIHYMGDIVQPFHSEWRYNTEYSAGDKGANAFPLKNHYGISELHALWDMVLYEQHTNIARPFTPETWDAFQVTVKNVTETYRYAVNPTSVYRSINYDKMCVESFDIAKTLYDGVTENEEVPQAYLDKNIPIAYERLVIGGYRLYYTIDYIFGDSNEAPTFIEDAIKSTIEFNQ